MTRTALPVLALLLAVGSATAQTGSAASGQTPQAGVPGAAPTQASPTSSTPQGTVRVSPSGRATRGNRPRRSSAGISVVPPASTAPVDNSAVTIFGSDAKTAKPSDDHPLLAMDPTGNPLGIRSGTPIQVLLTQRADSGHVRNGDVLNATLAAPLAGLSSGTPVQLTVVQASRAGALTSAGELSLQVTRIGTHNVLSVIVTALGKEGKKELADAAPAVGTEAEFPAGQPLSFPAA